MRTKKPWVLARRVLEGWYVLFMGYIRISNLNRALSLFSSRFSIFSRQIQCLGLVLLETRQNNTSLWINF
jgi:hypothetical protein